jgi:hypothetical protein
LIITSLTHAQAPTARLESSGTRSATVTGHARGVVPEIRSVRAVGAAVALPDGRIEQRYTIIANGTFTIMPMIDSSADLRVSDGHGEIALAKYVGTPGYHTEIVVRTFASAVPVLSVMPPSAPVEGVGVKAP